MLKCRMHVSLYENRCKQGLSPCIAKCSMCNFLKMLKYGIHFSPYKNRYKQGLSPCIAKCSVCNSHPSPPPTRTHICTTHLPSSFARWKTRKGSDLPNQSFLSKLVALKCSVATSWKSWVAWRSYYGSSDYRTKGSVSIILLVFKHQVTALHSML